MDQLNQERRGMFGGLRVPFDLNMLVLALGAVIGFWGLMWLTELMTGDANLIARVWDRVSGGDWHRLRPYTPDEIAAAAARGQTLGQVGPLQPITWFLTGGIFLGLWTFFSTAISRIAAMKIAREETLELREAAKFAGRKFVPVLSSVLFVATILFVFYMICNATLAGFAMRIPGLDVLVAILFFTVLLSTFFIVFSLVLGIFGMNLAASAIATESSDTWDGISRAWNYILVRPWHVLLCYGLTGTYLAVFSFFGLKFIDWSVDSLAWGTWGAGEVAQPVAVARDELPQELRKEVPEGTKEVEFLRPGRVDYFRGYLAGRYSAKRVHFDPDSADLADLTADEKAQVKNLKGGVNVAFLVPRTWKLSAAIIWFWLLVSKLIIAAYALQYFFAATTTLYFLLRKEVEDEDYGEIVVEEEELEEEAAWEVKEPSKPGATAPAGGLIMPGKLPGTPAGGGGGTPSATSSATSGGHGAPAAIGGAAAPPAAGAPATTAPDKT